MSSRSRETRLPVIMLAFVVIAGLWFSAAPTPRAFAATITIDGHIADWAGVADFTEISTDAGGGSGDLTGVAITTDATNFYVRWDENLTANTNKIKSDGFAVSVSRTANGIIDAKIWVLFDSGGVALTKVEYPIGTFTNTGTAQQTCNVVACPNGAEVSVEAGVTLASC